MLRSYFLVDLPLRVGTIDKDGKVNLDVGTLPRKIWWGLIYRHQRTNSGPLGFVFFEGHLSDLVSFDISDKRP